MEGLHLYKVLCEIERFIDASATKSGMDIVMWCDPGSSLERSELSTSRVHTRQNVHMFRCFSSIFSVTRRGLTNSDPLHVWCSSSRKGFSIPHILLVYMYPSLYTHIYIYRYIPIGTLDIRLYFMPHGQYSSETEQMEIRSSMWDSPFSLLRMSLTNNPIRRIQIYIYTYMVKEYLDTGTDYRVNQW